MGQNKFQSLSRDSDRSNAKSCPEKRPPFLFQSLSRDSDRSNHVCNPADAKGEQFQSLSRDSDRSNTVEVTAVDQYCAVSIS